MAGRASVEDRLHLVERLREEDDLAALRAGLTKAIGDHSNLVVAEAAKIIAELELSGFEPTLLAAWQRMMVDPIKSDKGCTAKTAIVEALGRLNHDDPDFFLTGMKYHQVEPAWPSSEETAANVRGNCAFSLARSRQFRLVDKLVAFVDLMQDSSRMSRVYAAQAIADTGQDEAIPVLRLKLLLGDAEPEVLGACMSGLLKLAPATSIPLVVRFLTSHNEDVELEAAAALGECGLVDAVDALLDRLRSTHEGELRRSLIISIGLSRESKAVSFLISLLEAGEKDAEAALDALRPSCVYRDLRECVRTAVQKTGNSKLIGLFERKLGRE